MSKTIGIYHRADLDGITSGAIIKHKYPKATLIGLDYSDSFENLDFSIFKDALVIMADFSLPMEMMAKIGEVSENFIYIDHHVSAIKAYNNYIKEHGDFCEAYLCEDETKAACLLTWEYLMGSKAPKGVKLLSDFDVWNNEDESYWNNKILPFQYGVRSVCSTVDTFPTEIFDNDEKFIENTIADGALILRFLKKHYKSIAEEYAYEAVFDGKYNVICLNIPKANSNALDIYYDKNKHDFMIIYKIVKDKAILSFYTENDDVDCSLLAKNLGGGGHKKAAGCQVTLNEFQKIIKFK